MTDDSVLVGDVLETVASAEVHARERSFGLTAAFGVVDQGVVSLANLAAGLLVIRAGSKEEYGLYGVAYLMLMLGIGVSNALFSGQAAITYFHRAPHQRDRYAASMVLGEVAISVALACAALLLLWLATQAGLVRPNVAIVLAAAFVACPAAMLHDFMRCYFFLNQPGRALCVDLFHGMIWLSLSWAARHMQILTPDLATIGAYGVAAFIVAMGSLAWSALPLRQGVHEFRASLAESWEHGRWSLGGVLVNNAQNQSQVYLLALLTGAEAVADINASRLLIAPLGLVLGGIGRIITPRLSRLYVVHRLDDMRRLSHRLGFAVLSIIVLYAVVILWAKNFIVAHVFHQAYQGIGLLVLAWLVTLFFQTFDLTLTSRLQVAKRFRSLTMMNAVTAIFVVLAGIVVVPHTGALGSMVTLAAGQIMLTLLLGRAVGRADRTDQARWKQEEAG